MITDLIYNTRTVRRFQQQHPLDQDFLLQLVDLARVSGSARNAQVLTYMVIGDEPLRQALFPLLGWAGYLADWPGPGPGERPVAYIVCLLDRTRLKGVETEAHCDLGIATQNMLLGAAEQGVYGCRIGAFSTAAVLRLLQLEDRYQPLLVVALGYPAETVVLEEIKPAGDIRYWHDEGGVHHVPKRRLADILLDPPVIAS